MCTVKIIDLIPGASAGGNWSLLGYSEDGGSYSSGGTWPWTNNSDYQIQVNFDNVKSGYYKLLYYVDSPCYGEVELVIPVLQGSQNFPYTLVANICESEPPTLIDLIGSYYNPDDPLSPSFNITGNGTSSPGYNPVNKTFDTGLANPGPHHFNIQVIPTAPTGYVKYSCSDCYPMSHDHYINIGSDNPVLIELNGCIIDFVNPVYCSPNQANGYYTVLKDGLVVSDSLPYDASDQEGTFQVVFENCYCNLDPSNEIVVDCLGCSSSILISLDNCILTAAVTNCSPSEYLWYLDGVLLSTTQNNTLEVTSSGSYQCRISGCPGCDTDIVSNSVSVSGCEPCNATFNVIQNGCTITVEVTNCSGTPIFTFSNAANNEVLQSSNINTYTSPPVQGAQIEIDVTGCCEDFSTIVNHDCPECACDSTIILDANCDLSVDTLCDGAEYDWYFIQDQNTENWKGSGTSITPDENGTWKLVIYKPYCLEVVKLKTVDCVGCGMQINTLEVDQADCHRIQFTYSGASGSNISVHIQNALNEQTCLDAVGWETLDPSSFNYTHNTDGTGSGWFDIPSDKDNTCIKLILIDEDTECGLVVAEVFIESCCDDIVSINLDDTNCLRVLTVQGAPPGSTYSWSGPGVNGETTNSVEVYSGVFTVSVSNESCTYVKSIQVPCCDTCGHIEVLQKIFYWFVQLSQNTANYTYIKSFIVNGVQLLPVAESVLPWMQDVSLPTDDPNYPNYPFNPTVLVALNALAPSDMVFEYPEPGDFTQCNYAQYFSPVRLTRSSCITTFEIIVGIYPDGVDNPPSSAYKFTEDHLYYFYSVEAGWIIINDPNALGDSYMQDDVCLIENIDLCT